MSHSLAQAASLAKNSTIVRWMHIPVQALRRMIDLNHHSALNGNDPNSCGGLLRCLGLCDRPMHNHAERLEPERYAARAGQPSTERAMRIAVVGAGIAGLTAARALQDHGHMVVVFDKSPAVGGRTAVRRHESFAFDHGAQYFTARDPRFRRYVDAWIESGVVAEWQGRVVALADGSIRSSGSATRYVGVPGMNGVAKHLARGLQIAARSRVHRLARDAAGWQLTRKAGDELGRFDAVVVALPSAQAEELLATAGVIDARVRRCRLAPCWAVLLGFARELDVPFDGAFVDASPLSWVARNNSKPGRPQGESWVLHAGSEWSTRHLELDSEEVVARLTAAFEQITGLSGIEPAHRDAHRWRYALPPDPLDEGCLWNLDERWVVCGDWCHGARVEGAFLSGMAAAGRLLGNADAIVAEKRSS